VDSVGWSASVFALSHLDYCSQLTVIMYSSPHPPCLGCMHVWLGWSQPRRPRHWQVDTITITVQSVHVVVGRADAGVGVLWLARCDTNRRAGRTAISINPARHSLRLRHS
jgi:hypothetical protein